MKWVIIILVNFLPFNIYSQPTDQEILETLTEIEKILILHEKTISDFERFIPEECEFPISNKEDILECYRWGYNRFKLIYKIDDWCIQITFKKESVGYLIVM